MLTGRTCLQFWRCCRSSFFRRNASNACSAHYNDTLSVTLIRLSLNRLRATQNRTVMLKNVVQCRRFCADDASLSVIFHIESEEDFTEKVLKSSLPVLVDFYADWCGPCKMFGPRIEAKVLGREGNVLLAKVNVDYATDLAMDYEVNSVPTVLAIKSGEVVGRFEGIQSDDELDQFIDSLFESE